jgi:hypothetical protein
MDIPLAPLAFGIWHLAFIFPISLRGRPAKGAWQGEGQLKQLRL